MSIPEAPLTFRCREDTLIGILHPVAQAAECGVLIVVGGPQYRIGSHRQFVQLARSLAVDGIPAMRFDTRGMGDSGGEFPGFEHIDDDIDAAVGAFFEAVPGLKRVVLWGLCDAASAILFYAHRDSRVAGAALANPWVRTEAGLARAHLRHHYTGRLMDAAFWRRLFTGRVSVGSAIRSFIATVRTGLSGGGKSDDDTTAEVTDSLPLPERMAQGLKAFDGLVLLILSGEDLTAREFEEAAKSSPLWRELLAEPRMTRRDLKNADHTFSSKDWCESVSRWTCDWVTAMTR